MLLPALSQARNTARAAQCLSNERQIGIAVQNYVTNNENWLPNSYNTSITKFWFQQLGLWERGVDDEPITCPANDWRGRNPNNTADAGNYAWNIAAGRQDVNFMITDLRHHSRFGYVADAAQGYYGPPRATTWFSPTSNDPTWIRRVHNNGHAANLLFLDGHAETVPDEDIVRDILED